MRLTPNQQDEVIEYLGAGLGVEDAAVDMKVPVADVRAFVADLRASGALKMIFERAEE